MQVLLALWLLQNNYQCNNILHKLIDFVLLAMTFISILMLLFNLILRE